MSEYRMPAFWDKEGNPTKEDAKLGWLREAIQEGTTFLKSQRAYSDIDQAVDLLYGPEEKIPKTLSKVYVNRLKRQIREQVATLSNLRPSWCYTSDNRSFENQNVVLNKLVKGWWKGTFADRSIREALQFAAVEGTGYISPIWEKDFWCTGRGDIQLHSYGARDVLPVQLPKDHNIQRAYTVIIRTEAPIAMAHAMYPLHADRIVPDRSQPGWFKRGLKKAQRFLSPALAFSDQHRDRETTCPVVDIYNAYVLDLTVNGTGKVMPMGDAGTNWYYEVPFVGQMIPSGIRDADGKMLFRQAAWEDCLIYPMRRLFIATNTVELKDGPSPWWHGKVPIAKFTMDDWPFEYLGLSLVRDGANIQAEINKLKRVKSDVAQARIRPGIMYDDNAFTKTAMDSFDSRQPNQRVAANMSMGNPIQPILPWEFYDLPVWIREHEQGLVDDLDYVMAHRDMAALAKARQLPASDTVEKLFEVLGPIPQDQSRTMERSLRDIGEMVKCLFFQFYTTPRRVQLLGENGIVQEDYDYKPGDMIPARDPDEAMEAYFRRARRHTNNFPFQVNPGQLHQMTQMTRQLSLMQLFIRGFPIDPWTMAEAFDFTDFGPPPEGTKNMIERWVAWMRMRGELQADMQALMAQMLQGIQSQGLMGALGGGGGSPLGGGQPPGRPPSGHAAPSLETKSDGRSIISESK